MSRWPTALLLALLPACRQQPYAGVRMPGETTVIVPDAATGDVPPRTDDLTLTIDGHTRHLIVHLPGGDPGAARPLVFNLHGSGGTAADQQSYTGMDALADAQGFIAVYPDGAIGLGYGFAWNVPGQPLSGGGAVPPDAASDIAFFAQAITALGQRYAIDGRRIYATGFSGGGRMASQIGCDLSQTVAAVAPVAGLRFPDSCAGARPVPVVSFHGTADGTNPYDGGGPPYWTYSVPSAAAQWAAHDACPDPAEITQPASGVELSHFANCAAGTEVALYTIAGAGHEWPSTAIDASSVMWAFFMAHPLE